MSTPTTPTDETPQWVRIEHPPKPTESVGWLASLIGGSQIGQTPQKIHFEAHKIKYEAVLAPLLEKDEELTFPMVVEYVERMNETFPNYSIDLDGNLLEQIDTRKGEMIHEAENSYMKQWSMVIYIETYSGRRETVAKTLQAVFRIDDPIEYERKMLFTFSDQRI